MPPTKRGVRRSTGLKKPITPTAPLTQKTPVAKKQVVNTRMQRRAENRQRVVKDGVKQVTKTVNAAARKAKEVVLKVSKKK